MKKAKEPKAEKPAKTSVLNLFKDIIPVVDANCKELWDAAGEEGQKEIKRDFWNLNRYISAVRSSNPDIQEHFVIAVNEFYNKNWNVIQKNHPQLVWQTLCACSTDDHAVQNHSFIRIGAAPVNKKLKFLEQLHPNMKRSDLDALAAITTEAEIKDYCKSLGWEKKEIDALKL